MSRLYSTMTVKEIRDKYEVDAFWAKKLMVISKLLDAVDRATTVEELRGLLADFITYETGVE